MTTPRIAFIGAGNMAASLIGGLRAQGTDASAIRASDRGAEQRSKISTEHGIETFASNAEAIKDADVIVLSVKPQVMKEVCLDLATHIGEQQLVVSIAAGISCASPIAPLCETAEGFQPLSCWTRRRNRSSGTLCRRAAARAIS